MRPETWLEAVLGSRWRIRILRALHEDPGRMWTERGLARALQTSPNTVNLAVKALRDAGVLEFRRLGRSNVVRLRSDLGLIARLRAVLAEEKGAMDDVRQAIRSGAPRGVACIMFGSSVRGDAHESSDVDLLVVAGTTEEAERAASLVRQAVMATFPLDLSIMALDARGLAAQRKKPWLRNALQEGETISVTPLEAVR